MLPPVPWSCALLLLSAWSAIRSRSIGTLPPTLGFGNRQSAAAAASFRLGCSLTWPVPAGAGGPASSRFWT
jgi:hypothetical protein